jgi:hypothetical protein
MVDRTREIVDNFKKNAGELLELIVENETEIFDIISRDPITFDEVNREINVLDTFDELKRIHNFSEKKFTLRHFVYDVIPKIEIIERAVRKALLRRGRELVYNLNIQVEEFNKDPYAMHIFYEIHNLGVKTFYLADLLRNIRSLSEDRYLPESVKVSAVRDYLSMSVIRQKVYESLDTKVAEYSPKYFSKQQEEDILEEAKQIRLMEIFFRELPIDFKTESPRIVKTETKKDSITFHVVVYNKNAMQKRSVVVEIKDTSNADIRKTHSFVRDSDKVPASYGLYQMFSSLIFLHNKILEFW